MNYFVLPGLLKHPIVLYTLMLIYILLKNLMKKQKLIQKNYYKIFGIGWNNLRKKTDGINHYIVYYQKMNYQWKIYMNIYF